MNQIRIALMTVTTVTAAAIAYAGFAPPSSKPVKTQVLASVVKPETRVFAQVVSNSKPTLNTLNKPKTPMVQAARPTTPRIQFVAQHQIVARVVLQRVRTDESNYSSQEGDGGERD